VFTPELKEFLDAYHAREKSKKGAKSKESPGKASAVEEAGDDAENDGGADAKTKGSPKQRKCGLMNHLRVGWSHP
jgi:hypothetical protein